MLLAETLICHLARTCVAARTRRIGKSRHGERLREVSAWREAACLENHEQVLLAGSLSTLSVCSVSICACPQSCNPADQGRVSAQAPRVGMALDTVPNVAAALGTVGCASSLLMRCQCRVL